MDYTKPTVSRMDLGVEHCMCGGPVIITPVGLDLGS